MWAVTNESEIVNLDFVESICCSNCGGILRMGDKDIYFAEPNAVNKIAKAISNGFRVIRLDGKEG